MLKSLNNYNTPYNLFKSVTHILFLTFCLLCGNIYTQNILVHPNGVDQFYKLNFNEEMIAKNKVRSITTEHLDRKSLNKIAKNTTTSSYYEFNDKGELTMYYKTFLLHTNVSDTLVEFYTYNDNGSLKELRRSEFGKYGVYSYTYKNNRVVEIAQAEEENALDSCKTIFIPVNHKDKYKEKFIYENIDSLSYYKYTHSEDNVRYKEEEIVYELGKLKKEQTRYIFSKQQHSVFNYYYFDKDLVKKEEVDNYLNKVKQSFVYKYDSIGRVNQMETYKENEKNFLTEFLYKENTGLLDAIIHKNTETNSIEIIKFTHTLYQ